MATLDELQAWADAAARAHAEGCCMDDAWRGHACPYHLGMIDGLDVAIEEAWKRLNPAAVAAALPPLGEADL